MSVFLTLRPADAEIESALPVRVLGPLGVGGQGLALRVARHGATAPAALKIYDPRTTPARVDREVANLRQLSSPFVVGLIDHGQVALSVGLCRYALFELIDGCDGASLIGRLEPHSVDAEVRTLLLDVGQGIQDMWNLRIVHRDIKPANIMRRSSGRYSVLDLGLARHLDDSTLTQQGLVCGTPGYMSPEQAAGRRSLTLRSDYFSLGILAYEVASGRHPFHRQQAYVGQIPVHPLHQLVPAISLPVSRTIQSLLQPSSLDRPSRHSDLARMLTY